MAFVPFELTTRPVPLTNPLIAFSALPRPCRDEFNLKLALLSNQWQGVVRRAQQRRGIIDSLIRQWQRYREMVEKLRRWLVEISHPAEALQAGATVPLQQARSMLDALQVLEGDTSTFEPVQYTCLSISSCCFVSVMQLKEKVFQRQQGSYILTVEAGRQLLLSADNRAEVALQAELTEIQEQWKRTSVCLEEQKKDLATLLKVSSHLRCFHQFQPPTYRLYRVIRVNEARLGCDSRWVSLAGLGAV